MTKRHNITSERGQTMTEFAIVLPILVVLLFGIIQFSGSSSSGSPSTTT
jgi:Flp pilus assembly protein TadG